MTGVLAWIVGALALAVMLVYASTALDKLAAVCEAYGRLAEAEWLLRGALAIDEKTLRADHPSIAKSLSNLAGVLQDQYRLDEAESLYRRALAIDEKTRPEGHLEMTETLMDLAQLYVAQREFAKAEPLYRRALAIREKALPEDHPDIGAILWKLADMYRDQRQFLDEEAVLRRAMTIFEKAQPAQNTALLENLRLALNLDLQDRLVEAEMVAQRALAMLGKGGLTENSDVVAVSHMVLAHVYHRQGRLAQSETLAKRALADLEKARPGGHPGIALLRTLLARVYANQGRLDEAEALLNRALELEKTQPVDERFVSASRLSLAQLYRAESRLDEAGALYHRALEIDEKRLPKGHPAIVETIIGLAGVYQEQGRLNEAEILYNRALPELEKARPQGDPFVTGSRQMLAAVYRDSGRLDEAEALLNRTLSDVEKARPEGDRSIAATRMGLAGVQRQTGRLTESDSLYNRALPDLLPELEKELSEGNYSVARTLDQLVLVHRDQGRLDVAEALGKRALELREKALPNVHPEIALSLNSLAVLSLIREDWPSALAYAQRATKILIESGARERAKGKDSGRGVIELNTHHFRNHILAGHHVDAQNLGLLAESYEMAQWARRTAAAAAVGQMAARQSKGESPLALLVRERQDLEHQWNAFDQRLTNAVGRAEARRAGQLREEMANIGIRLAAIDTRLANEFPDYTALANPKPVSVTETQALLQADEVLLQFIETPELREKPSETFAWIVTKSEARWIRVALGTRALAEHVGALRCGLDFDAWTRRGCFELLNIAYTSADRRAGKPLPFDLRRAHKLYQALLGEADDLINGKHLLVIPSWPLTALPFQVLVTEPPTTTTGYAEAAWLGTRQPITVLPSVASLSSLRKYAKASRASRPYIGFGNPLLDGKPAIAWQVTLARQARDKQRCSKAPVRPVAPLTEGRSAIEPIPRSRLADVMTIRTLLPLPETTDELCAVGRSLGATEGEIRLGAKATETEVKALSVDGRLASYRILHFATHGALSGEIEGNAEPGLILTPPDTATEADDGYLAASEIAQLKLDADWVMLSACNTAASDKLGAEPLSGLARAFFYAGARALLVSYWYVDTTAAVQLIVKASSELDAVPGIGRAEALRRSMLGLISSSEPLAAHPAHWATFVVVGEGAP
jgi:CHAT domain-containing protein/tetratricopeptide (TPR) repeat protein